MRCTNEHAAAAYKRAKPMLLAGEAPKLVAYECGISKTAICNLMYRIGLRKRFVTDAEWRAILAGRRELTDKAKVTP